MIAFTVDNGCSQPHLLEYHLQQKLLCLDLCVEGYEVS